MTMRKVGTVATCHASASAALAERGGGRVRRPPPVASLVWTVFFAVSAAGYGGRALGLVAHVSAGRTSRPKQSSTAAVAQETTATL